MLDKFIALSTNQPSYFYYYMQVIFTNESNIERWKKSRQAAVDSKIGRLEQFIKVAGVPIQVIGLFVYLHFGSR